MHKTGDSPKGKSDKFKTISIVLMALLTTNALWNLYHYYQIRLSLTSELIPEYVAAEEAQPHFTSSMFTFGAVVLSFLFFYKSKYAYAFAICVAALFIQPFL
jgi:hypothetical protein